MYWTNFERVLLIPSWNNARQEKLKVEFFRRLPPFAKRCVRRFGSTNKIRIVLYLTTTYSYVGFVIWLAFDTQLEACFVGRLGFWIDLKSAVEHSRNDRPSRYFSTSSIAPRKPWKYCQNLGPLSPFPRSDFLIILVPHSTLLFFNGLCREISKRSDINRSSPVLSVSSGGESLQSWQTDIFSCGYHVVAASWICSSIHSHSRYSRRYPTKKFA